MSVDKTKFLVFTTIFLFLFIQFISAETYKTNQCVELHQICSSCSYVNLTSIKYPNGSITNFGEEITMDKISTSDFVYNCFNDTSQEGYYLYNTCGDKDGIKVCENLQFQITGNGKSDPSGSVIVLFISLFIILMSLTCWLTLYSIGHFIKLDFDITDLAFDWGLYFAIIALYFSEIYYLGNTTIEKYLLWFLWFGGVTLIFIPIIAFIFSIIIGSLNKRKINVDMSRVPRRWRR